MAHYSLGKQTMLTRSNPTASAVASVTVPAFVLLVASVLNADLYNGPTYYVPGVSDAFETSCFDAGARPVDFVAGLKLVRDWTEDNLETKYVGDDSGSVCDRLPEGYECPACDGTGTCEDECFTGDPGTDCEMCDGSGWVEESELYWEVTPRDQAAELFGSELAGML